MGEHIGVTEITPSDPIIWLLGIIHNEYRGRKRWSQEERAQFLLPCNVLRWRWAEAGVMHVDNVTFTEDPIPMHICMRSPHIHSTPECTASLRVDLLTTFPSTLFSKRVNCVKSFRPGQRCPSKGRKKGRILRHPLLDLLLAFFLNKLQA